MSIKFIDAAHKRQLREGFPQDLRAFVDFRQQEYPPLPSGDQAFSLITESENRPGSHDMTEETRIECLFDLPSYFSARIIIRPEFTYDTAFFHALFGWRIVSSVTNLVFYWSPSSDTFTLAWNDGGTERYLQTRQFDDGTSLTDIDQDMVIDAVIDLRTAQSTGSQLYWNRNLEDSNWSGTIAAKSTNFPDFTIGGFSWGDNSENTLKINSLRIWPEYLATQADIDNDYRDVKAEEVYWDLNGHGLGRTRCAVRSRFLGCSLERTVIDASGKRTANRAHLRLHNPNGEFSDDQYAAFDAENEFYNGLAAQAFLHDRCPVWIEHYLRSTEIIRRGDCESATAPMVRDETSPSTNAASSYARSSEQAYAGSYSWKAVADGSAATFRVNVTDTETNVLHGFAVGDVITMTARFYVPAGSITPTDAAMAIHDSSTNTTTTFANTTDEWQEVSVTHTIAAGSVRVLPRLFQIGSGSHANGNAIYVDDVRLTAVDSNGDDVIGQQTFEPVLVGRLDDEKFKRNSPHDDEPQVLLGVLDGVEELERKVVENGISYEDYDISDPAAEATSLVHALTRLATQKTYKNYLSNSSFENAAVTPWFAVSATSFSRVAGGLFGSYQGDLVNDASGSADLLHSLLFTGDKQLNVGEVWTFSIYVKAAVACTCQANINESDSVGVNATSTSSTLSISGGEGWQRISVSHTIIDSDSDRLQPFLRLNTVSVTLSVDAAMLTQTREALNWFVLNNNASTAADDADSASYDTVGFDVDTVAITHPWVLLEKFASPWTHMRKLAAASLAQYLGMDAAGTLKYRSRLKTGYADPTPLETIDSGQHFAAVLEEQAANHIIIRGAKITKFSHVAEVWRASASGHFTTSENTGRLLNESVADGATWPSQTTYPEFYARYEDMMRDITY